ncbi:MAG: hypothetical protein A3F83_06740 [Candidatus Glassbacteria bacterium RIFCSPLOWO2_12_FULL_58_11]|uniref:Sortilin N-terminal domain-containing protein n=1 Tax=Candidatus Glassbacteria bacterium RIFCSPLOWO2_12_FULL_58_11 TaxID=1817867 RepID=A0A1F5YX05_9BACT|nr:MAG: hypothetical protein A3F83_06740 [Candidatus Glassbacteria bacterium RIFCSPLOWO2_12_FULL_58_11]
MRKFSVCILTAAVALSAIFSGCIPQSGGDLQPLAAPQSESSGWRVLGPGGGGAQFEPTISPADPSLVFVRCDMTGAYVSENAGESWRMFNLRTVVQDFEFDPNDPNVVYASNSGLYRSEDRGKRWRLIYPDPANVTAELMLGDHAGQRFVTRDGGPGGQIARVRVEPANSDHLYLGVSARGGQGGGGSRILYSPDRGANWKELASLEGRVLAIFPGSWIGKADELTVITDRAAARLGIDSGDIEELSLPAETVLAADGGKGETGSILYLLTGGMGMGREDRTPGRIYRSTDFGKSWSFADESLISGMETGGRPASFSTLAVCAGHPETVYLSCRAYPVVLNGFPQRQSGILKTDNSGESWNWTITICGGEVTSGTFNGGWIKRNLGWFGSPSELGVCPSDPNICYGTDSGRTWRTLNGGITWDQVVSREFPDGDAASRGLDVTTCYGIHLDPFNKDHFFITYTDIGLFHTFNGGRTWRHSIVGIPNQWRNTCYWLEFDPAVKGRIWSVWANVHDLPRPKMFRSGNLVNGRQQGGVAASGDGGRNWGLSTVGVMEDGEYKHAMRTAAVCTHIVIDTDSPVESRTLYVCDFGYGVWKSGDAGRTWEVKNKGLKDNFNCWRMVRLPGGRLILLVARGGVEGGTVIGGALYTSDDGAESWQSLALPLGVTAPNDLVYDPSDPDRMYLSCWPLNAGGGAVRGEPQPARVVEGDQLEVGRRETGGGLFRTEDGGKSWKQVFHEDMHVYAAAVDPANTNTVFINTFNSAAFRSADRGETWKRLGGYNFKWGHRPVVDTNNLGMLFLTTFGGSVYYGPAEGVAGAFEDIENLPAQRW